MTQIMEAFFLIFSLLSPWSYEELEKCLLTDSVLYCYMGIGFIERFYQHSICLSSPK